MPQVRVFIIDDLNRVLMVKHKCQSLENSEEFWAIPGGGVEKSEYSEDAGVREVKEETKLDIRITRLLWTAEEILDEGMDYCNYFLGEIIGGNLALGIDPELENGKQVLSEVRFFTREELKSLPRIYPEVLRDEFWKLIDEGVYNHQVWRSRPSKGFGLE